MKSARSLNPKEVKEIELYLFRDFRPEAGVAPLAVVRCNEETSKDIFYGGTRRFTTPGKNGSIQVVYRYPCEDCKRVRIKKVDGSSELLDGPCPFFDTEDIGITYRVPFWVDPSGSVFIAEGVLRRCRRFGYERELKL